MTPQEQVTEFHRAFGVQVGGIDTDSVRALRAALIEEEATETTQALLAGDNLLTVARELADLVYMLLTEPPSHLALISMPRSRKFTALT